MSSARRLHCTYEQYLHAAASSELRLEYYDGEIFAMAGGTPEHGMLAAELIAMIRQQLPASCRLMTSDVRVRVLASGLATYPDVSVVCGELVRAPDDPQSVVNPVLVVKVLSPSTADYDRGEKLRHYKLIPSLRAVLLVAHDARSVTAIVRGLSGWVTTEHRDDDVVTPSKPALKFTVADVYRPLAPIAA